MIAGPLVRSNMRLATTPTVCAVSKASLMGSYVKLCSSLV